MQLSLRANFDVHVVCVEHINFLQFKLFFLLINSMLLSVLEEVKRSCMKNFFFLKMLVLSDGSVSENMFTEVVIENLRTCIILNEMNLPVIC